MQQASHETAMIFQSSWELDVTQLETLDDFLHVTHFAIEIPTRKRPRWHLRNETQLVYCVFSTIETCNSP